MNRVGLWMAASVFVGGGYFPASQAQNSSTAAESQSSDTLEEIVVTAERREENEQKVPASVAVVNGADLAAQGRISTAQILETVPDVQVAAGQGQGGGPSDNPNGNITIRGVQATQGNGGLTSSPPATATYIDDVYQGVGGDYDLNRVEVLRGPQGTLYGRSATGGVVAFHTADPDTKSFNGIGTAEIGSAELKQVTAAVNLPVDDLFAVRVAGRDYQQDGYFNNRGGYTREQEGRVKALFQPTDNLRVLLGWSIEKLDANSGGNTILLSGPSTFNFNGLSTPVYTSPALYHQYWAQVTADLGFGNLTYIGAYHDFHSDVSTPPIDIGGALQQHVVSYPLDEFHTEEIRLASESTSKLSWIVGANFYSNLLRTSNAAVQLTGATNTGLPDVNPAIADAPIYTTGEGGSTFDYGLFTEETYPVTDSLKITAGARFDDTEVKRQESYTFNANLDQYQNSLNPADLLVFLNHSTLIYRNFTYKLRAQYDLTAENTVYAMVSSGFLPGDQQLSPQTQFALTPTFHVTGVNFLLLPFQQERLTAYEIGSKNRFLNDTLQLNADAYYYDYSGYHELANTSSFGPPVFTVLSVPVRIVGAELEGVWRVTREDSLTLNAGVINAEITSFPDVPGSGHDASFYIANSRVPGVPTFQLATYYTHNFMLPNGSAVVPRAELLYTGPQYLTTYTQSEALLGEAAYAHQSEVAEVNLDLSWDSPSLNYSVTAYVRNVDNEIYKTSVGLNPQGLFSITGVPGSPRTWGLVLSAKF